MTPADPAPPRRAAADAPAPAEAPAAQSTVPAEGSCTAGSEDAPPAPARSNGAAVPGFTVGYVPGVMPGKWLGRWRERRLTPVLRDELLPAAGWRTALEDGTATACFVRLGWAPEDPTPEQLRTTHHAVHLYDERQVAALSTEDVLGVLDTLTTAQLREESTPQAHADIDDAAMAVELAAAGVGPVVLPMSVARLHARKDVTVRELTDAPSVPVFLVWPRGLDEETEDAVQRFVGIVRGRRESSGREGSVRESSGGGPDGREPAHRDEGARAARPSGAESSGAGNGGRRAQETTAGGSDRTAGKSSAKPRSGGWAKAGASTKPGLRRKPGKKVKNGRNRKRR